MCYYNGVKVTKTELIRLKQIEKFIAQYRDILNCDLNQGPLYNQPYPVIKANRKTGDLDIVQMEWGFLPQETKWPYLRSRAQVADWRINVTTLNAMSETLLINEKGKTSMFAEAAMQRRCLVPSTGFWEWRGLQQKGKSGKVLKDPVKYPYHIIVKGKTDEPFYMAGIYNDWIDEETGITWETAAVITRPGNTMMSQVHNAKRRMPTILPESLAYEWLFGKLSKDDMMDLAKYQLHSEEMDCWPVDKKFLTAVDPRARANYDFLPPLGDDEAPIDFFAEARATKKGGSEQGSLF